MESRSQNQQQSFVNLVRNGENKIHCNFDVFSSYVRVIELLSPTAHLDTLQSSIELGAVV